MDLEIAELKLELRNWESNFLKQNGRKPTKSDAAKSHGIKKKYDKFLVLKKKILESRNNKENENCTDNNGVDGSGKIFSPKNKFVGSVEDEKENSVWGTKLLKKNSMKAGSDEVDFDAEFAKTKSKKKDSSPNSAPGNWRENIRKNIGHEGSSKRLPMSLKRRASFKSFTSESSLNSSSVTDSSLNLTCEEHDKDNIFVKQFNTSRILSSSFSFDRKIGNMQSSPPLSSPFLLNSCKRTSILSRPVKMTDIENEDLSDLRQLDSESEARNSENTDTKSPSISNDHLESVSEPVNMSKSDLGNENMPIFKDETESFIEANFRETSQVKEQFSFSLDKVSKINYNAICLDSETVETAPNDKSKLVGNSAVGSAGIDNESSSSVGEKSLISRGKFSQTNFVRLNMKQKCFRKKGAGGNFLRKQVYKQKLAKKGYSLKNGWKGRSGGFKNGGDVGFRNRSKDKCFKCGETGHWANKCKGQGFKKKTTDLKVGAQEEKESLEEILENVDLIAAAMKGEASLDVFQQNIQVSVSDPVLSPDEDASILLNRDVMSALKMFKYSSFRPGQDKAISRILKGLPTLLVLSTGSGKSLCYQLPAYLYATKMNAITLVVSPLVSLMDDQVRGLPRKMKATRIHSGMSKEQRNKAMLEVESGKVHVLLVSPEAITSWAGMSPKYSPLSKLPPIAFACVDECHCLSEWSHAFRPSYLRVCQVLRDQLGVKCLVGLTATASMDTCASVAKQLGISDISEGIIAKIDIPRNLILSVSKDRYKDEALAQLLIGDRFSRLESVIVYCTRRDEAARIASFLRVKMVDIPALDHGEEDADEDVVVDGGSKKRKKVSKEKSCKRKAVTLDAECYHAGMSASERRRIQTKFMNGTLRVVVATVAFGMGIDKQDVRSVIHYNMPMSFERYVQEIGRAGRDGQPAHCHLFLDADGGDLNELSRHSYKKSMDRYTIKRFVKKIFPKCNCSDDSQSPDSCKGHFSAMGIDDSIEELDVGREGLETLLCYLEIEKLVHVHLPTETMCTIQFYGGPRQMIDTAKKVRAVALALKLAGTKGNETAVHFNAMKVADELNMELPYLKKILRYLTYDTTLSVSASEVGKSGIEVEFSQLSFCVQSTRKASDEFLDAVVDLLYRRVVAQENKEIAQLQICFNTMQEFAYSNVGTCRDSTNEEKSTKLKKVITDYFRQTLDVSYRELELPTLEPQEEAELRRCIRQFLCVHGSDLDNKVTGRAIARIFHGIDSPRYPAKNWGPARRFWRSKLHLNFNVIRKLATEEILGNLQR